MEKTINCAECKTEFTYEPPAHYPDRRKYCDPCGAKKQASFEAKETNAHVEVEKLSNKEQYYNEDIGKPKEKEIKKENGEWQSTVYNRTVAPNSYEVGTAGNRFKLYFETPQDLKDKMKELRDAGLMDMPIDIPTGE